MIVEPASPLILNGIAILAEQALSRERIPLPDGSYAYHDLLILLRDQSIPYYECHKCGRWDYCKHARPHPANPKRAVDIQCGVVVSALGNLLLVSWNRILGYNRSQLQHFFDGLFYFVQFILETEITIGNYIDHDHLSWAGEEMACREFGYVSHLRVYLDRFAAEFGQLEDFAAVGTWVAVEGQSEEAFIERLGELRFYTHYVGGVETYGGKGNVKPRKLRLHIRSLENRGYSVTFQGDEDGSQSSPLQNLVNAGMVKERLVFSFKKDFEAAFPPPVLHYALRCIGCDTPRDWLVEVMSRPTNNPIVDVIEQKFGHQVDKVELARSLADVAVENWAQIYAEYPDNEIVRWMLFLRTGSSDIGG